MVYSKWSPVLFSLPCFEKDNHISEACDIFCMRFYRAESIQQVLWKCRCWKREEMDMLSEAHIILIQPGNCGQGCHSTKAEAMEETNSSDSCIDHTVMSFCKACKVYTLFMLHSVSMFNWIHVSMSNQVWAISHLFCKTKWDKAAFSYFHLNLTSHNLAVGCPVQTTMIWCEWIAECITMQSEMIWYIYFNKLEGRKCNCKAYDLF